MMERMNFSRLNMTGLGTARVNLPVSRSAGIRMSLLTMPCSWRKGRLGFGLTEVP